MISGQYYVNSSKDIPQEWIFETYLGLTDKLVGQEVKMKSIFNLSDTNPSMYLYYSANRGYFFKCFSTGKHGDAIQIVMYKYNLSFIEAFNLIKEDYIKFLKSGKIYSTTITTTSRWKPVNIQYRKWNTDDVEFWTKYNIGSKLLEYYNVKPIKSYIMQLTDSEGVIENEFIVSGKCMYCYQKADGTPYKIYQPFNATSKFITLMDFVQGVDQMEKHDYLVITSSLKDIMAVKSLNLKVDVIAPTSERCLLSAEDVDNFKLSYKAIVTLMDSDQTGIESMQAYKEKYGFPMIYLPLEKDLSDIIKVHGKEKALYEFYPKLSTALENYSVTL